MPRALKNLDISLGLAIIPVQLFTATSSHGVAFHLLHAKCGSRIQMRLECPIHGIVPREETAKGYEVAKDEYVRFEPDELKALEQASSSSLVIDAFVPERAVDPVYFEDTYYLGAGKNGERGYRVLVQALQHTGRVAVGTFTWRGKTTPIAIPRTRMGCSSSGILCRGGSERHRDRPGRRAEDP
jgi:DNA end-binding protein Ku